MSDDQLNNAPPESAPPVSGPGDTAGNWFPKDEASEASTTARLAELRQRMLEQGYQPHTGGRVESDRQSEIQGPPPAPPTAEPPAWDPSQLPPQPLPAMPQLPPTQAPQIDWTGYRQDAEALGLDPERLLRTFAPVLAAAVSPIYQAHTEGGLQAKMAAQQATDFDYPVYSGTLQQLLQSLDAGTRWQIASDDTLFAWAVNAAKGAHVDQLATRRAQYQGSSPVVVGRFTEGASPGMNVDATAGPPIPPEYKKLTDDLPPDARARVAARLAARRARGE